VAVAVVYSQVEQVEQVVCLAMLHNHLQPILDTQQLLVRVVLVVKAQLALMELLDQTANSLL
jgi:hypothetical protein